MSQTLSTRPPTDDENPVPTSLFVNGVFPRRRWLLLLLCAVVGFVIAFAWSSNLADDEIGFRSANAILGRDAATSPISTIASGILFAFVSGLAGSFTACNIAVFGAVGPLVGQTETRGARFRSTIKPLGWLAAGMIPVSAAYGFIVGLVGTKMPQFSASTAPGIQPRIGQAMVVFGLIGMVMIVLGLAAAGIIGDPLAAVSRRYRNAPLVLMGALIGGFLIGRPYPLFHQLFRNAADRHDPFYGAAAFTLQSLGNIVVMSVLFIVLSYATGGRLQNWLTSKPVRITILSAGAFLVAGVFMFVYWDLRILGRFNYIWFPSPPWT